MEEKMMKEEGKMMDKEEKMMDDTMMDKEVKLVSLEQTKGAFTQESLTLPEGKYQFEIMNNGVGHDVGFVLVPKGKEGKENHIEAAYVTKPVATGKKQTTKVVTLEKGEYEYFCPLNPTERYTLIVE